MKNHTSEAKEKPVHIPQLESILSDLKNNVAELDVAIEEGDRSVIDGKIAAIETNLKSMRES